MVDHLLANPVEEVVRRHAQILDAIAAGVTVQDGAGRLVYANRVAASLTGWSSPEEMLAASPAETLARFELIDEIGEPMPWSVLPGRRLLAGERPEPIVVGFRVRATGEERWSVVGATLIGGGDEPRLAVNTFHDVTSQVLAERDLRNRERRYREILGAERAASRAAIAGRPMFDDLTDSAPILIWMSDAHRSGTYFNRGWLEFTGRALADELDGGWTESIHPADRDRVVAAYQAALARQEAFEIEFRLRRHDGVHRWVLAIGVPRRDADSTFQGYVVSSIDVEDRRRAADLAQLVAEATLRLDESVGIEETVHVAAGVAIPTLADWCVIDLLEPDGSLRRAAIVASSPDLQERADALRAFPTPASGDRPGRRVASGRGPIVFSDLRDEETLRRATAGHPELAAALQGTGARSAIVQPLTARGEVIGVMFFVVGPDRSYDETDLEMASGLAPRIALPIANARLYAAEQAARREAEATASRMEQLQRVTGLLATASDRATVIDTVVREGSRAIGADGAVLVLRDETRSALAIAGSHGYDEAALEPFRSIPTDADVPLATAIRDAAPVWVPDLRAMPTTSEVARRIAEASPNRSACAVPLIAHGATFGSLGLSFGRPQAFDEDSRSLIRAYADLGAQALARVNLGEIRERLVDDLEAARARLETVLRQLPEGLMIAEAPSGRVVLGNDRLEEILGVPSTSIDHSTGDGAYRGFDSDGRELGPGDWPLARAVHGETVPYTEIEVLRADGSRVWVAKRASPVLDRSGRVIAGVATIIDITDARQARLTEQFLTEATQVLSSSLDYEVTLNRVAQLAVPRVADWCVVEAVDAVGYPTQIAAAHSDRAKVEFVRRLRQEYPAAPDDATGPAEVRRTGKPIVVPEVTEEMLEAAARDERHLELIRQLHLRSYLCVPLVAGGRVLGTLTLAAAESGRAFGPEDQALAENLAGRAASAIENARLFREGVRFKAVLDATLDAVLMFDPLTLAITYVNQGAIDQLGAARAALLGSTIEAWVDDHDAIGLRGLIEPLMTGTEESRTITLPFRGSDGTMPMEVRLQLVTQPGEPPRILTIARDISDRIEAQARLQRLADAEHARAAELNAVIRAMGEGVVVCAPDGRITLTNPAAEQIFPSVEEKSYADILAQLDDPEGQAPVLGTHCGPVELRVRGDEERWIELSTWRVAPRDEAHEAEAETIVLLRDVTAQRQAQAVRDTFIGVLSHELRTPVTTIYAGAKVLSRGQADMDDATRADIFRDIVTESERLHRLVEDVIAMTRFGEDEGDVGTEPVLLQRVLPTVIGSEEARWPGVSFVVDVPTGLPTVIADPTYVEQVVRNLLSNAAKYGGPGARVEVHLEGDESEVRARILDDGPGFPEDESERLFELFFRSTSTARAAAGAGIGLFVCARLIRAMGGRIWATNRAGGGAEFGFALRVMVPEDA